MSVVGLSCGAALSFQAHAQQIDGGSGISGTVTNRTETLDASSPVDSWSVLYKGTLQIFDGAVTNQVIVSEGGYVYIDNGTVNGVLSLSYGTASVVRGTISNTTGRGLQVGTTNTADGRMSSTATLQDSSVFGMGIGAIVSPLGNLTLNHSIVTAAADGADDGEAIRLAGSTLRMTNGSVGRGESVGLSIIGDTSGPGVPPIDIRSSVVLDNSTLEGLTGPAIRVVTGSKADISIQNGSTLLAGDGNLLDVTGASEVTFNVDNSTLTGDLVADDTSSLDVTLQNNAQLTGNLINTNSVAINSGANWTMVGDAEVKSLSMGGGSVTLGSAEQFYTLSLGELSGTGMFNMHVNLLDNTGDLLDINGEAHGDFLLNIQNTGLEPNSPEITPLHVVHTEGGNAVFDVVGGSVDIGVYSYQLEKQGDDWFIVGAGKTISPSTQAALGLFSVGPTVWYGELATLRNRMGEIRTSGEGGGWIRGYGNQYNVSADAGFAYKQRQKGLSLGVDLPVPVGNGQLLVGVMAGHSESDLSLSRGTAGKVDSGYVGAYGTWLTEEGYYLDAVAKLNRFRNKADVPMTNGVKAKGSYDNFAYGGSLEFGKHIRLQDSMFVEPYAQLSTVNVKGDSYTLDNGLRAKNDHTLSVLGKAGATLGRNLELSDGGLLQPYLRAAMVHEFSRRGNTVKVNDVSFDNNLFGTRAELGVGVSAALSKNLQLHANFDYMKGEHIEQPWGVNIGMRYGF
ncbi:autotransporter outer membrane beta-barrel domain-containing protein [Pseudomonas gingeri NCPPB 3146 = LMG 5327]|uniref:Autotransporter outer membrane beta-barrel domain-containing protein n=2 Tax=Pseudomonas gingeri TaxID=117681 RepID=A0A7Y8CFJ1_9PSED|nr:autotransporter outer membrane beta-barrel domain-containing protein [Pseudomonas gingeri]NWC16317.1 autotransporter outer membrane beta-barrel domain-containing protein [Pseudomonas gingeri]NWE49966.1 autotransporter outer membrane beta-barrel domain-containing protein [Pseudomonas gingeri]NWE70500.1 autotransporter outer membrane beta-barrel domain-containing protein [Pseudomonas gingeri]PNQ94295.1 autotransporter outer membrane beta-barrel domain-containing protein [Pseudomonas gingeri NC